MRGLAILSFFAAIFFSASLHLTHGFPMKGMASVDCMDTMHCSPATSSPLADCIEHCISQRTPVAPTVPFFIGLSVFVLCVVVVHPQLQRILGRNRGIFLRDVPFGKFFALWQLRTVEIKS